MLILGVSPLQFRCSCSHHLSIRWTSSMDVCSTDTKVNVPWGLNLVLLVWLAICQVWWEVLFPILLTILSPPSTTTKESLSCRSDFWLVTLVCFRKNYISWKRNSCSFNCFFAGYMSGGYPHVLDKSASGRWCISRKGFNIVDQFRNWTHILHFPGVNCKSFVEAPICFLQSAHIHAGNCTLNVCKVHVLIKLEQKFWSQSSAQCAGSKEHWNRRSVY